MLDGELLEWKSAEDLGVEVVLLDDDFSNAIDGSGYLIHLDLDYTPKGAQEKLNNYFKNSESEFFNMSTIKVCIINLAFYIPSHDMLVSILMEIRFDKSGSVRTRSFEVLPL